MSGFDELADEIPDEEWDAAWAAYTAGAETSGGPVRGYALLPAGVIEVRGDQPGRDGHGDAGGGGLLGALPSVSATSAVGGLIEADLVVDVHHGESITWSLTNRRNDHAQTGAATTLAELVEDVVAASIAADDQNLYMRLAVVDDGHIGVGLADPDRWPPGIWASTPWSMLTDSLVALRPGSRTVNALEFDPATISVRSTTSTLDCIVLPEGNGGAAEPLDVLMSLLERSGMTEGGSDWGTAVPLVREQIADVAAGAVCLPVAPDDLVDVPEGLTKLSADPHLPRFGTPWLRGAQDLIEIVGSSSVTPGPVLIGAALDVLDRVPGGDDRVAEEPGSVEFLLTPRTRDAFEAHLADCGFNPAAPTVTARDLRSGSMRIFTRARDADVAAGGQLVDLTIVTTTVVGSGPFAELVDLDDFNDMAVPVRIGSRWMRGLDPAHRFILACLRLTRDGGDRWARASALLNAPWNAASMRRVLRLADRCGALSPVRSVILEMRSSFPPATRHVLGEVGI